MCVWGVLLCSGREGAGVVAGAVSRNLKLGVSSSPLQVEQSGAFRLEI